MHWLFLLKEDGGKQSQPLGRPRPGLHPVPTYVRDPRVTGGGYWAHRWKRIAEAVARLQHPLGAEERGLGQQPQQPTAASHQPKAEPQPASGRARGQRKPLSGMEGFLHLPARYWGQFITPSAEARSAEQQPLSSLSEHIWAQNFIDAADHAKKIRAWMRSSEAEAWLWAGLLSGVHREPTQAIVYNERTGELWWEPDAAGDGSGAGAAGIWAAAQIYPMLHDSDKDLLARLYLVHGMPLGHRFAAAAAAVFRARYKQQLPDDFDPLEDLFISDYLDIVNERTGVFDDVTKLYAVAAALHAFRHSYGVRGHYEDMSLRDVLEAMAESLSGTPARGRLAVHEFAAFGKLLTAAHRFFRDAYPSLVPISHSFRYSWELPTIVRYDEDPDGTPIRETIDLVKGTYTVEVQQQGKWVKKKHRDLSDEEYIIAYSSHWGDKWEEIAPSLGPFISAVLGTLAAERRRATLARGAEEFSRAIVQASGVQGEYMTAIREQLLRSGAAKRIFSLLETVLRSKKVPEHVREDANNVLESLKRTIEAAWWRGRKEGMSSKEIERALEPAIKMAGLLRRLRNPKYKTLWDVVAFRDPEYPLVNPMSDTAVAALETLGMFSAAERGHQVMVSHLAEQSAALLASQRQAMQQRQQVKSKANALISSLEQRARHYAAQVQQGGDDETTQKRVRALDAAHTFARLLRAGVWSETVLHQVQRQLPHLPKEMAETIQDTIGRLQELREQEGWRVTVERVMPLQEVSQAEQPQEQQKKQAWVGQRWRRWWEQEEARLRQEMKRIEGQLRALRKRGLVREQQTDPWLPFEITANGRWCHIQHLSDLS